MRITEANDVIRPALNLAGGYPTIALPVDHCGAVLPGAPHSRDDSTLPIGGRQVPLGGTKSFQLHNVIRSLSFGQLDHLLSTTVEGVAWLISFTFIHQIYVGWMNSAGIGGALRFRKK